jgi:hypothetical protein
MVLHPAGSTRGRKSRVTTHPLGSAAIAIEVILDLPMVSALLLHIFDRGGEGDYFSRDVRESSQFIVWSDKVLAGDYHMGIRSKILFLSIDLLPRYEGIDIEAVHMESRAEKTCEKIGMVDSPRMCEIDIASGINASELFTAIKTYFFHQGHPPLSRFRK